MDVEETRICSLEAAVGNAEACPGPACPFWERGGAALDGRCAFDEIALPAVAGLASWLLEIRRRLEAVSSEEDERVMRSAFHRLLSTTRE